ncbi:MOSC domain-containing protein [Marinomonas posidonica]|uniref:MOSC domain-containing protein n=1 Tax=Marinomonas posidonica TaxID=936476 RepID=UPI001C0A8BC7|nr:MOSC domain-containing protein [Marinomonas posidonica]
MSKIKQVTYKGQSISTGIFKEPIKGKFTVNKENIEGDEQADLENHGGPHKAVYAFSYDYYDYWRTELEDSSLKIGIFGENLTVTSLNESNIYIGDRFQLGGCILEVSQPRMPCYKLGIALNNPKAPKRFIESYCTGVYFRVIQEGDIEVGNQLIRIYQQPDAISIKTLFQAYFDRQYDGAQDIFKQALLIKELAPAWKKAITKRLSRD